MKISPPAILLLLLTGTAHGQGRVWTVDDNPGTSPDFSDLSTAVDAASDGDTLLIGQGVYLPFVVDGKSLTLVAETGALVNVMASVSRGDEELAVRNLAAHQRVRIHGIAFLSAFTGPNLANRPLVLEDNLGEVRIEDCSFGAAELFGPRSTPLTIRDCATVTLSRSTVSGNTTFPNWTVFGIPPIPPTEPSSGSGLHALDSNVYLHDCLVRGAFSSGAPDGDGTCGTLTGPPSPGVYLDGGFLFASGCRFEGGPGGPGGPTTGPLVGGQGGPGGDALVLAGGAEVAVLRDTQLVPGGGGGGPCEAGVTGTELVDPLGAVVAWPFPHCGLKIHSPLRVGESGVLELTGQPGDLAFLALGAPLPGTLLPAWGGTLHVAPPGVSFLAGVVPEQGSLQLPIIVPPIFDGSDSTAYDLQSAVVTPRLEVFLGAPASLVVLASDF